MYYYLFLLQENNFLEPTQVDKVIGSQLSNIKLIPDGFLTVLVETYMIDRSCNIINLESIYIKDINNKLEQQRKATYLKKL